jgi:hypothetical protein
VPQIWNHELEADALRELAVSHYHATEYLAHIEAAIADLSSRGARSMTARAVVDQLAMALAADAVEFE